MNLGGPELLIVVAIAVLIFGAGWLPKAARNLGKAKVEFDEVQRQFNETKDSVVEAAGIKELESTVRKANTVLNTSPQKLMKDAAKSAVAGGAAPSASTDDSTGGSDDDQIEDAEIVDTSPSPQSEAAPILADASVRSDEPSPGDVPAPAESGDAPAPVTSGGEDSNNINLDFR